MRADRSKKHEEIYGYGREGTDGVTTPRRNLPPFLISIHPIHSKQLTTIIMRKTTEGFFAVLLVMGLAPLLGPLPAVAITLITGWLYRKFNRP